jgi:ADP-heptose:LPS heptosyltransferase
MKLQTKKMVDWYVGGAIMLVLKPCVWLLGHLLKRDHSTQAHESICFIKMLGGGSLVIAYPALLGLRHRYPSAEFSLICTPSIRPFAQSLNVFDRIDTIDDSSCVRLVTSTLRCLIKNFRVDTVVDFEVYSRLTTVMSTLTCARNRIGFYLASVFWRRRLHTHLIFFNQFSGSYHWYDAVARLLGAEPIPIEECRSVFRHQLNPLKECTVSVRRIAIGHACSELAKERMLNKEEWVAVFQERVRADDHLEILLLGGALDHDLATRIINALGQRFSSLKFRNCCGQMSLAESLGCLITCDEFWGVDSALLHYARLLGLKCTSFWGPTDPATRLRPIPGLKETVYYGKVPCSPCTHVTEEPPCHGKNVCIQSLFKRAKDCEPISWLAWGAETVRPHDVESNIGSSSVCAQQE